MSAVELLRDLDASSTELLAFLDRSMALRTAVEHLVNEIGFDVAWSGEPSRSTDLIITHLLGAETDQLGGLPVVRGQGLGGKVLETGRTEWVDEYFASSSITHHFDAIVAGERISRMIATPIRCGTETLGVLWACVRREGAFTDREATVVTRLAQRTGLAVAVADRSRQAAEVAVQEERRRLSLDLHDSVGAMLFTMRAKLRELSDALDTSPELRSQAQLIEQQALDAATALRQSMTALHQSPSDLELLVAIRADCAAFEERSGIVARLVALTDVPTRTSGHSDALLYVVKEALRNVEKHAEASSVVVTLSHHDGGLGIAVSDDGCGASAIHEEPYGLGLRSSAERLARVGGHLVLQENDDDGMTLRAWIPV